MRLFALTVEMLKSLCLYQTMCSSEYGGFSCDRDLNASLNLASAVSSTVKRVDWITLTLLGRSKNRTDR
ncbi:MAG: hypothetical protein F6K08_35005 [Okeania sp. SIO1H6]|nr:hypothetical protein [Okeania sp. SIO1H6]